MPYLARLDECEPQWRALRGLVAVDQARTVAAAAARRGGRQGARTQGLADERARRLRALLDLTRRPVARRVALIGRRVAVKTFDRHTTWRERLQQQHNVTHKAAGGAEYLAEYSGPAEPVWRVGVITAAEESSETAAYDVRFDDNEAWTGLRAGDLGHTARGPGAVDQAYAETVGLLQERAAQVLALARGLGFDDGWMMEVGDD